MGALRGMFCRRAITKGPIPFRVLISLVSGRGGLRKGVFLTLLGFGPFWGFQVKTGGGVVITGL